MKLFNGFILCILIYGVFSQSRIAIKTRSIECGQNEEYSECGTRCGKSCNDVGKTSDCSLMRSCNIGCFCVNGFLRDENGVCVPPEECGKSGAAFPETVRISISEPIPEPHKDSIEESFDYKDSEEASFHTSIDNQKECPAGEIYSDCGNHCSESCNNINNPTLCPPNFCDIGCFCKVGLFRYSSGICVPQEKCDTKIAAIPPPPPPIPGVDMCPINEKWKKCGCHCLELCENRNTPEICPIFKKEIGCFCIKGFYRNKDGHCVEEDACDLSSAPLTPAPHPICPEHEEYTECGNRCLESIDYHDNPSVCLVNRCDSGCFCIREYYRDEAGLCIGPESGLLSIDKHRTTQTTPALIPPCPEHEAYSQCGNRCLESLDNIDHPTDCPPDRCDKGCFCIHDFYRDHVGLCVVPLPLTTTILPPPTIPHCPDHEAYNECGNRCVESIDNMDNSSVCPPNRCDIGCFCVDSLYRDHKGMCVKPESGILSPVFTRPPTITPEPPPLLPRCPAGEEFHDCGNRCLESCDNVDHPSVCPPPGQWCDIGCFCKPNLYRDAEGICVLIELCEIYIPPPSLRPPPPPPSPPTLPLLCAETEIYSECGDRCLELIEHVDNPTACPLEGICESGCFCIQGLYRDHDGHCVHPPAQTTIPPPPPRCSASEEYQECGSRCLESCATIDNPSICPQERCDIGCFCKKGLYRDEEGICVPELECEVDEPEIPSPAPRCPAGELYNECGSRCRESCGNVENSLVCSPERCDVGCFCKPHLFRDEEGICVPLALCEVNPSLIVSSTPCPTTPPPHCSAEEHFSECGNRCLELCVNKDKTSICSPHKCDVGCFCNKGLFRNDEGFCVPAYGGCEPMTITQCSVPSPPKCPEKEVFHECASRCAEYCINSDDSSFCPPNACETGCFCEKDFFRNDLGLCVPKDDCSHKTSTLTPKPEHKCPENEEYDDCGTHCGEDCEEVYEPNFVCSSKCESGCFCREGFLRNCFGVCVQKKDCELEPASGSTAILVTTTTEETCGHNEEHSDCYNECGHRCDDYDKSLNCPRSCRRGCTCISGYLRNDERECVLPNQCPKQEPVTEPESKTENQTVQEIQTEYTELATELYTEPESETESHKEPEPEPVTEPLITNPHKNCSLNEHYTDCGSHCGQSCNLFTHELQEDCPPDCKSGCFCNEGLYRDKYDNCVLQDQCTCDLPPKVCSDMNEEYFSCHSECGRTCKDFDQEVEPKCPDKCARGCFCVQGFVRNEDGFCIKPQFCDKERSHANCEINEVYLQCGTECGHHCNDIGKNLECDSSDCKPGCFCQNGYHRGDDSECYKPEECAGMESAKAGLNKGQNECGNSEEYTECGNFCDENCEQIFDTNACSMTCEKGCHCIKDHKRNNKGICVPIDHCTEIRPHCGLNEVYSECGSNCGHRCSDINKDIHCALQCENGCFCAEGFFRDTNGSCIFKRDCFIDPIECKANEVYSKCGHHCGETCEDLLNPIECPTDCEEGCFCGSGFYRDLDGICSPKENCDLPTTVATKPICPINEEFNECGDKCRESCDEKICPTICETGCFCMKGYLRNHLGQCVLEDDCKMSEQCVECGPNAYYISCGSDCGRLCSDIGKEVDCEVNCNKGCFCKYGFHRNERGYCVTQENCGKHKFIIRDKVSNNSNNNNNASDNSSISNNNISTRSISNSNLGSSNSGIIIKRKITRRKQSQKN